MNRRAPSQPPVIFGFEHIKLLGSGGFADVFLYQQQHPKRQVAVKVLLSQHANTAASFTEEANLMAQLAAHPSIVSIYEAGVAQDGRPFLVMEYCSRPNLQARHRRERFSEAETLRVGVQIASAIEAAHRIGILHRDVKPANILVTEYGRPALTDFGISTAAGSEASGMSVPWSPPEAFRSPPGGDASSDVYSLGATLYTLLTNRTPFEVPGGANGTIDVMSRIQSAPLPRTGRPEISEEFEAVLARSMAKRPEDRYRTAIEFARALQRVQIGLGMQETPIDVAEEDFELSLEDDDEPRTRFRGVTSIDAQQTATEPAMTGGSATAPSPAAVPGELSTRQQEGRASTAPTGIGSFDLYEDTSPPAGLTVLSQPPRVPEAPPLADTVHRPTPTLGPGIDESIAEPARRGGRMIGWVVGGGVAAAAAAIASALILNPTGVEHGPATAEESRPVDAVGVSSAPTVESLGGEVSGTEAIFTWVNPDPQPGDLYLWRSVVPGEEHAFTEVDTERAALAAEPTGRTCIEVVLRRANGTSAAQGAEACTP